jgi:membrane protein
MNIIRKYYERFRNLNPKNTEMKLLIIILMIGFFLFRGINGFEFSWELPILLAVFIFSMTCHEVAHAYVAYKFGDDTAKREGRITLNPLKHLDLTGIILPILLLLSGSGFIVGWAKPVPVNFSRLKPERPGLFCVAIAGITVNFIFASIALVIMRLFGRNFDINGIIMTTLLSIYIINLALGLFNLIPVTPLDGGRIIYSIAGKKVRDFYNQVEKYGILIILFLVYIGFVSEYLSAVLSFFLSLTGMNIVIGL